MLWQTRDPVGSVAEGSSAVIELLRTNDLVMLSWARALLEEAGIDTLVFDEQTSALEGSISAICRRLMVREDEAPRARWLLDRARREIEDDG